MADKQVAKKSSSNNVAVLDDLIMKTAGQGLENVGNDDITIPRLAIVQTNSPQRSKKDEKYIEGADEGHIFNTVSNELFADGMTIIPCGYRKTYVEWVPREKGGGLVSIHDTKPDGTKTDPKTRKSFLGDNQIVDTAEHFVLVNKNGVYEPAVLTMTSTNLSVSRKLNTLLKMKKINVKGQTVSPPSFLYEFNLSTVQAENDLGRWYKYKIEETGQVKSQDVFKQAQEFADSVSEGKVKASEPVDTEVADDAGEDSEEAPF